jgi:mycolipenoyl-CoA---2-(long-chain-fatty acyl)-trehalose mycolipenoyltransferase / long-chain-acyl-CoA---trehalose acyltransferase
VVVIAPVHDWVRPGALVSWSPTPATLEAVREAPPSDVPASYQQTQHLVNFYEHRAMGLDFSRLVVTAFELPGRCDVRTMDYVINAHVRRHDTYHSWFEYEHADRIHRRTVGDRADLKFRPVKHGELTADELREHLLSTPDPLQWDCFRFGVIQRGDHFTFFASIDHVHIDPAILRVVYMEIILMYTELVGGGAPIALPETSSYLDFCVRQRDHVSALSLESPQVASWIEFVQRSDSHRPPVGRTTDRPVRKRVHLSGCQVQRRGLGVCRPRRL